MTFEDWKNQQLEKGNLYWSSLNKEKVPQLTGKWRVKYGKKKADANYKGIDFNLTFEEYLMLAYEAKLKSPAQIGTKPRNYQLGRIGDTGGYAKDNCRFITHIRNRKERDQHYCQSTHCKKLVENGTHNFLGQKPWKKPSATEASLEVWEKAFLCYVIWKVSDLTNSELMRMFKFTSRSACKNLLDRFENGWNPVLDHEWLEWKQINKEELHESIFS